METLEKEITRAWHEVFGREHVGPHDNFFELGGNSLIAMDLSDLLTVRLGIEVPVLTLYQHPSVAELVAALSAAGELQCPA